MSPKRPIQIRDVDVHCPVCPKKHYLGRVRLLGGLVGQNTQFQCSSCGNWTTVSADKDLGDGVRATLLPAQAGFCSDLREENKYLREENERYMGILASLALEIRQAKNDNEVKPDS